MVPDRSDFREVVAQTSAQLAVGNVDVCAYDNSGRLLCYTVTHEGLIFVADN